MNKKLAVAIGILIAIIVIGSSYYAITTFQSSSNHEITVYVYKGYMAEGPNGTKELPMLFGIFENETGVKVKIKYFNGARDELLAVMSEPPSQRPDVVLGLDNILIHEGAEKGLFLKLPAEILSKVPKNLQEAFDPQGYGVPVDYGLLAIVVDESRAHVPSLSIEDFVKNSTLASMLVTENPQYSSTGLSFLLWQYTYYTYVLHQNWTMWWKAVKDKIKVVKGWGEAWDIFTTPSDHRPIITSYGTDPAYEYYKHKSASYKAFLFQHGGKRYGWFQIEGAAIVNGTRHLKYAEEFLDFLLSPKFQEHVPLDNWMYPVINVSLPYCYHFAVNPKGVVLLNKYIPPGKMSSVEHYLLLQWLKIFGG